MMRLKLMMASALIATVAISTPAMSQEKSTVTVEDMAERFKKQKTRGLTIASPPTTPIDSATAAVISKDVATIIPENEQVNLNVSFDFDSAALRANEKPKLIQLCNALKMADVQKIRILGHTDASGSASYNERLSKLRAEEVKRFLTFNCGYPAERMEALGVGERFPFDQSDPRADVNRRVEFQALS